MWISWPHQWISTRDSTRRVS